MINKILTGVFNIVIGLTNSILAPIDAVINIYLPDLSKGIDAVGDMFSIVNNGVAFALDMSGLSDTAITLIISYFVFVLTVPLTFSSIKLALKWYNSLKI